MAQKMAALNIQNSQSLAEVQYSRKVFQLDTELAIKLACAYLSMFNASIRLTTDKMNEFDIYECADLFIRKYTHESISDLSLCLRMVKTGELGIVYNRFDTQTFFQFFEKYLDYKWKNFDEDHFSEKASVEGSFNRPEHTQMFTEQKKQAKKEALEMQKDAKKFSDIYFSNKALVHDIEFEEIESNRE